MFQIQKVEVAIVRALLNLTLTELKFLNVGTVDLDKISALKGGRCSLSCSIFLKSTDLKLQTVNNVGFWSVSQLLN